MSAADVGSLLCPRPAREAQIAVARFLDHECGRIAELNEKLGRLPDLVLEPAIALAEREWEDHLLGRIGYRFSVQLGKKLYEDRIDRATAVPYLRNANVHWDRLALDDLKVMNFDRRERTMYELRAGDLLVCEGGEPGRCAVWSDEVQPCFFQMALHRVRPFGADSTRYLLWSLRTLSRRGAFTSDGPGRYTHLTAEQLRAVRVPLPEPAIQAERVRAIDALAERAKQARHRVGELRERLAEYRDALITEAVTGQLDVTRLADTEMEERALASLEGATP